MWKTYEQVHEDLQICGSALVNACGLKPGEESFVGLYANNCPQVRFTRALLI